MAQTATHRPITCILKPKFRSQDIISSEKYPRGETNRLGVKPNSTIWPTTIVSEKKSKLLFLEGGITSETTTWMSQEISKWLVNGL